MIVVTGIGSWATAHLPFLPSRDSGTLVKNVLRDIFIVPSMYKTNAKYISDQMKQEAKRNYVMNLVINRTTT